MTDLTSSNRACHSRAGAKRAGRLLVVSPRLESISSGVLLVILLIPVALVLGLLEGRSGG